MWEQLDQNGRANRCGIRLLAGLAALPLLCLSAAAAPIGDPDTGEDIFTNPSVGCTGCHPGTTQDPHPGYLKGASLELLQKLKADANQNPQGNLHPGGNGYFQPLDAATLHHLAAYLSSVNPTGFKLVGNIEKQDDKKAAVGAFVMLNSTYLPGQQNIPVTQTDAGGYYEFQGHPAGDYTITAGPLPKYSPSPTEHTITVTKNWAESTCAKGLDTAAKTLAGCNFEMQHTGSGEKLYWDGNEGKCGSCHVGEPADNHHNVLRGARLSILENLHTTHEPDPNNPNGPLGTTNSIDPAWLTNSDLAALALYLSSQSPKFTIKGSMNEIDPNIKIKLTSSYLPAKTTNLVGNNYAFTNVPAGDYDVTPDHVAYDFTPDQHEVAVTDSGLWENRAAALASTPSGSFLEDIDFTAVMAEPFATGKALYNGYCANCHGINPSEYDSESVYFGVSTVLYAANPNTVGAFLPVNGQPSEEAVSWIGNPADPNKEAMINTVSVLSQNDVDKVAAYLGIMHPALLNLTGTVEFSPPACCVFGPKGVIPGAEVTVAADNYDQTKTAITDENGSYYIDDLGWGPKTITIAKSGFEISPASQERPFALPFPSLHEVGTEVVKKIFEGAKPVITVDFEGGFNIDTSADQPAQQLYSAKCASCHGNDPSTDQDHILFGARLSVLKDLRFDLTDAEAQLISAYIGSHGPSYSICGYVYPAYGNTDVENRRVSIFSETAPGDTALTNFSETCEPSGSPAPANAAPFAVSGLRPGDYVVNLPDARTLYGARDVLLSNKILQVRNFWSSIESEEPLTDLPHVDFWLAEPLTFSQAGTAEFYELIEEMKSGGSSAYWQQSTCDGTPPGEEVPFDAGNFIESTYHDNINLSSIENTITLAGPVLHDIEGTEFTATLLWDRRATIDAIGADGTPTPVTWEVTGGSTTVTLRYDAASGAMEYCGSTGDRLLGLTDNDGILRIDSGTLDGNYVIGEATIEGGSYTPPPVLVPALAAWGILAMLASLTAGAIARLRGRRP